MSKEKASKMGGVRGNTKIKDDTTSPSLVGEGSYGCVYNPPLPCSTSIDTTKSLNRKMRSRKSKGHDKAAPALKYVGKVFPDDTDALDEYAMMKKIHGYDKHGKYTIPIDKKCRVRLRDSKTHTHLKKCDLFREEFSRRKFQPTYIQLVSKYGGITLSEYMHTHESTYDVFSLCSTLMNVVKGLEFLQRKNICHRDIKEANILVSTTKRPTSFIIDFGLMIATPDVYKFDELRVLEFEYGYYPPEFRVISNYMKFINNEQWGGVGVWRDDETPPTNPMSVKSFKSMLLRNGLINIDDDLKGIFMEVLGVEPDDMWTQLESFVERFVNSRKLKKIRETDPNSGSVDIENHEWAIRKFMGNGVKKVDVYSIGVILTRLVYYSRTHQKYGPYDVTVRKDGSRGFKRLVGLIRKCVDFDVRRRPTMRQVRSELGSILKGKWR